MSNEIKIDSDVPPPDRLGIVYPFKILEVGQSFFMEDNGFAKGTLASYSSQASYRFRPKKFISRKVAENGKTGRRFWRVQ